MADRPILFSAPMVRALLDGRKTQTRRILKPQPTMGDDSRDILDMVKFQVGDRLWVRETWRIGAWRSWQGETDCVAIDYLADDYPRKEWVGGDDPEMMCRLIEQSREDAKADGRFKSGAEFEYRWSPGQSPCRTRVSIHMPRWASRLTLTVTDVRVERLQDISEADAIAEGCRPFFDENDPRQVPCPNGGAIEMMPLKGPLDSFRNLWNDINGPEAWEANPWVAAYSFDLRKENIDNG